MQPRDSEVPPSLVRADRRPQVLAFRASDEVPTFDFEVSWNWIERSPDNTASTSVMVTCLRILVVLSTQLFCRKTSTKEVPHLAHLPTARSTAYSRDRPKRLSENSGQSDQGAVPLDSRCVSTTRCAVALRQRFPGYFRPSQEDFTKLWATALIVLDTNVLLDMYRIEEEHADQLFAVFRSIKDRVWVPHQFATEFLRNRENTLASRYVAIKKARDRTAELEQELREDRHFSAVAAQSLVDCVALLEKAAGAEIDSVQNDPRLDAIEEIVGDAIGPEPTPRALEEMISDGKARFERKCPPGFLDGTGAKKKPEPDRYGDYFAWCQIMDHAESESKPVILLTQEKGKDWWAIHHGRRVGPRLELVQEFALRTRESFHLYDLRSFCRWCPSYGLPDVGERTLKALARPVSESASKKSAVPAKGSTKSEV